MYVELYHFEHPSSKQFMMGNFHLLTLPISWSTFHSYMIDYMEANVLDSTKYFKIYFISGTFIQLQECGISALKFKFRLKLILILRLSLFLSNYLTLIHYCILEVTPFTIING